MPEAFRSSEVHRETVVEVKTNGRAVECILGGGRSVLVSGLLYGSIFSGDTIEFTLPSDGCDIGTEILVRKAPNSKVKSVYRAPIGYVTRLKEDRRGELYSLAEVRGSAVGVSAVRLNCDVIRDYFYVNSRRSSGPSTSWPSRICGPVMMPS